MTAQLDDTIRHAGHDWSLAGIHGQGLFDPREHGLDPRPASSACWHGFVCWYALRDGGLRLERLDVALDGEGPMLFGRQPVEPLDDAFDFTASYHAVDRPVDFTGGLLLGRGFLEELYEHMGFHPAWKYEHVAEIEFERGRAVRVFDRSAAMAELRERLVDAPTPGPGASRDELAACVARAFSRECGGGGYLAPPELTEEERIVEGCLAVARQHGLQDPFRVAQQAKKWTRTRWDEAYLRYRTAQLRRQTPVDEEGGLFRPFA